MSARSENKFTKTTLNKLPDFSVLREYHVRVGLPDDVMHGPSGLSLAEIGAVHEFGSTDGRIPARKPLRIFAVKSRDDANRLFLLIAKNVMKGADPLAELESIAQWAEDEAKQSYIDVDEPPLADRTLRAKKGDAKTTAVEEAALKSAAEETKNNPLIDTGAMKDGVIGMVVPND